MIKPTKLHVHQLKTQISLAIHPPSLIRGFAVHSKGRQGPMDVGGQCKYSKTGVKKTKIGFQYQLSLNADQKYCRMLPMEHSAVLLTFIKLPFVIKIFVLSILHRFYCTCVYQIPDKLAQTQKLKTYLSLKIKSHNPIKSKQHQ